MPRWACCHRCRCRGRSGSRCGCCRGRSGRRCGCRRSRSARRRRAASRCPQAWAAAHQGPKGRIDHQKVQGRGQGKTSCPQGRRTAGLPCSKFNAFGRVTSTLYSVLAFRYALRLTAMIFLSSSRTLALSRPATPLTSSSLATFESTWFVALPGWCCVFGALSAPLNAGPTLTPCPHYYTLSQICVVAATALLAASRAACLRHTSVSGRAEMPC